MYNVIPLISLYFSFQDKTFGLKNKKGNKNQKYIAQVEKQVQSGGNPIRLKDEAARLKEKKAKEDAKKREEEEKKLLNKAVIVQKVDQGKSWIQRAGVQNKSNVDNISMHCFLINKTFSFFSGVDPKSVFCAFFKQGLCKKGDKCKFSHDPSVEGKAAKRNLYADAR